MDALRKTRGPAGHRWARRIRRWTLMAAIIAVTTWVATTYGVGVYLQARLLYWQHECMGYAGPADQPAYRYDPTVAFGLQFSGPAYIDNDQDSPSTRGRETSVRMSCHRTSPRREAPAIRIAWKCSIAGSGTSSTITFSRSSCTNWPRRAVNAGWFL